MVHGLLRAAALVVAAMSLRAVAAAQDGAPASVRVTLNSGDVLTGILVSRSDDEVVIEHALLGTVTLPASGVATIEPAPKPHDGEPTPPAQPDPGAAGQPAAGGVAPLAPTPGEAEGAKWTGKVELGASGSEGNTDSADIVGGASAERKEELRILNLSAAYRLGYDDGEKNENRLELGARHEWLIKDTPWSYFVQAMLDVDEFKEYDARLALAGGVGYRFIDTEKTTFVGRLGAGAYYEFGGQEEIVPEGLIGADFRHKLNDRVDFTASATYFPNLEDFGEFRARAETALDVKMREDGALSLRLGVKDEYDSMAGNREKNDLFYFATLVYSF